MKTARGMLLIEVLLAIAFMATLVAVGTQVALVSLSSTTASEEKDVSHRLARELLEAARVLSASDWYALAYADRGLQYHAATTGGAWVVASSSETLQVGSHEYTRGISVASTSRDFITRNLEEAYNPAHDDPSTLLVTATVSSTRGEITLSEYITRWHNITCAQTEWNAQNVGAFDVSAQNCEPTEYVDKVAYPSGILETVGGTLKLAP